MKINIANNQGVNMLNKTILIKDAIIGLRQTRQPIFGSISYTRPASDDTAITIKTVNKIIQTPLNQIKMAAS